MSKDTAVSLRAMEDPEEVLPPRDTSASGDAADPVCVAWEMPKSWRTPRQVLPVSGVPLPSPHKPTLVGVFGKGDVTITVYDYKR